MKNEKHIKNNDDMMPFAACCLLYSEQLLSSPKKQNDEMKYEKNVCTMIASESSCALISCWCNIFRAVCLVAVLILTRRDMRGASVSRI